MKVRKEGTIKKEQRKKEKKEGEGKKVVDAVGAAL